MTMGTIRGGPTKWRWVTPARKGRWWPTRREAGDAAVRAGLASRDPFSDKLYLSALTWLQEACA